MVEDLFPASFMNDGNRKEPPMIDPITGLPLPDPFPEYVPCPFCGEAEVEAWCFQIQVICHNCGKTFEHTPFSKCRTDPTCRPQPPAETT